MTDTADKQKFVQAHVGGVGYPIGGTPPHPYFVPEFSLLRLHQDRPWCFHAWMAATCPRGCLPDHGCQFELNLTQSNLKSIGYVGQNGLWILLDVKKIHHRCDKPEYGRTPQHQAFWQSMSDKEADA